MTSPTSKPQDPKDPEPKAKAKAKSGSWDAIDTAPKDGTDVLVALMPGGRQAVAHWDATLTPTAGWALEGRAIAPTHWQALGPLPDPKEE